MTGIPGKDRQLNKKCSKAANAGFSLVELLIAVTILAIIVIPLLHMFVTSTRINVKSRQTLRATTVAQDIMEGLKAYNLDEVRTQFSLPDGTISDDFFYPTEGFYIVNSKMIQGGVREVRQLETDRDVNGEFDDPDDENNEIYYFAIENLKMQGGEYDALIKLDASTYTEDKAGSSGHDNAYNGPYYADTKSVSETNGGSEKDSSYHEDSNLTKDALDNIKEIIKEEIEAAGGTVPEGWDEITEWAFPNGAGSADPNKITLTDRIIEVVLEEENSKCKATITITYKCKYNGKVYESNGKLGAEVKDIPRTFSSGNFYLFYYPIYDAKIDNIVFTINDAATLFDKDQPLLKSITLAKQIRSIVDTTNNVIAPDMTDAELWAKEDQYAATVDIVIDIASAMESDLLFRTNFDTNMSQMAKDMAKASEDPDDLVIWNAQPGAGFLNSKIKQAGMVGDNVSDKVTNVIYDIEITVYKAGAAEHFKEGSGFESSPDVQRLATITNLD